MMEARLAGIVALLAFLSLCLSPIAVGADAPPAKVASQRRLFSRVCVAVGADVGPHVSARVFELLRKTDASVVRMEGGGDDGCGARDMVSDQLLVLALGNCSAASTHCISPDEVAELSDESFRVKTYESEQAGSGPVVLACHGRRLSAAIDTRVNYGSVSCVYHAMEMLGFAFMHPLAPHAPQSVGVFTDRIGMDYIEAPRWPIRTFHYHTQHPLELTEVLQGMDIPMFGPLSPECEKTRHMNRSQFDQNPQVTYCERWEDMVGDVNLLFEWVVANKFNRVEWLMLGNYKWREFDDSETRSKRMHVLTSLGHKYGLLIGADVPLGNVQQHSWFIVNPRLPFHEQAEQIRSRVDWVFRAGFDFITTESGLSEFTHPDCCLMRDLLEELSTYANITWGREAGVKVHCSSGQTCSDFLDPRTGEPLNFNFLPMFVHPSLGVFPHTVQVYALDDPTAGSYGNNGFRDIEDYMFYEAALGNRTTVFYGETAYWVNVDIDVPLYLPLYAQRRQHDLRRIARREEASGHHTHGQMIFDSGWEWGYWLNTLVAARAAWDPLVRIEDDWEAFRQSLSPFTDLFEPATASALADFIVDLSRDQATLLVFGEVNGTRSPNLSKLSGMAYLSGSDTWTDVPRLFGLKLTQPDKVRLFETEDENWKHVLPLLREMETKFKAHTARVETIISEWSTCTGSEASQRGLRREVLADFLHEVLDGTKMLALRAKQVRLLYESHDAATMPEVKPTVLSESRRVLSQASRIVAQREAKYRVPWARVGAWRENPTVYRFGYLWAVHSLYYWWRDQGLAEKGSLQSHFSPCYLNRMDASEVAVGWGKYTLEVLRSVIQYFSPDARYPTEFINCIAPPSQEYKFPRDLFAH